jgi:hypothetical protein
MQGAELLSRRRCCAGGSSLLGIVQTKAARVLLGVLTTELSSARYYSIVATSSCSSRISRLCANSSRQRFSCASCLLRL